ncbi:MAG TPA: TPM domain-containing protein, partial [Candidatus Eremiobacteraceae bacterium]|nr:TPM domain-containing protein [Candidatus Eremiobacteraceae bacterium]
MVCAIALALTARQAFAAEVPIPPAPTSWVTDTAGLLSGATRDALNQRLANYNRATGHQVIVWIGTTTGDTPLQEWTIRAFTAW